MSLTQLQAFTVAARLGSFTKAAEEMHMSQPAVSDLIRRLETELGARLFHRNPRVLVLTDAGVQLRPYAEQSVESARLGMQAVRSQLELGGGTANFGLLRNADFYLGTDLARAFHSRYPRVHVRLVGQNSAETATDVASGRLEAGLVTLPVADDGLEVVPLARDEILVITAPGAAHRSTVDLDDFLTRDLVLYDAHYAQSDPARRQLDERAQMAGRTLLPIIEVEYLASALGLVQAGIGSTIACSAAVASQVEPRGLEASSFTTPIYDTLALIKRDGMVLSPATRELSRMAYQALVDHRVSGRGNFDLVTDPGQLRQFFGTD